MGTSEGSVDGVLGGVEQSASAVSIGVPGAGRFLLAGSVVVNFVSSRFLSVASVASAVRNRGPS